MKRARRCPVTCPVCHCSDVRVVRSVSSRQSEKDDGSVVRSRIRYLVCRCSHHWSLEIELTERTMNSKGGRV